MILTKKTIPYLLILTAGVIAYINTLANGFVYDDSSVIKKNRYIEHFSNIKDIFSVKHYFARSGVGKYKRYGEGSYRPIVTASYFMDFLLFGKNPFGFHLINLIYHLILCALIYNLLLAMTKNKLFALISAILFAVHPLGTEPINAISFREDILCAVFLIIALKSYINYLNIKHRNIKYCFISNIAFFLSCLSKENGVILLPFIFVYNHMVYNPLNIKTLWAQIKRFIPVYIGYGATMLIYFIIRFKIFVLQEGVHEKISLQIISERTVRFLNLIAYYLKLIIFPCKLSPAYNQHFAAAPIYLLIGIPVAAILIFLIYFLRNKKYYSFFISWFLISLFPVSGLVYLNQPVAERYLYVPMIGIICCFTLLLSQIRFKKTVFLNIIVFLVIILTSRSAAQNTIWKTEFDLWDYSVKQAPKNYNALSNYAVVLSDTGRHHDSIAYFKKALAIDNRAQSHYNLSNSYLRLGMREKAIEELKKSISLDPNFSEAHNNLGKLFAESGRNEEAVKEIKIALGLNPYNPQAFNNLGAAYNQLGKYDKAIRALTRAIEIYPDYISAYFNLSSSFYQINELKKAEFCIRKVLKHEPDNKYALKYLRSIISQQKADEMASAIPPPKKKIPAIEQKPPNPPKKTKIKKTKDIKSTNALQSHFTNLYNVNDLFAEAEPFIKNGSYIQALPLYRKAMQAEPNNPKVYIKLAECYTKLGSFNLALKEINKALKIDPNLKEGLEKKSELERILRRY
ncbi:tetratricopeptide repeat protein [bacterium]|nr:tetratricopeptide repeat protein [bacterium]